MNVALFLSRRLRLTPGENRRPSTNVVIAVAGIACATAVMLLSLCVVLGFKDAIRGKIAGFEPAITIEPASNVSGDAMRPVSIDSVINATVSAMVPDAAASLAARHAGILKTDDDFLGVMFRELPQSVLSREFVKENLVSGALPSDSSHQVLLSEPQATKLKIAIGDKVFAYFFVNGALKARRFVVSGLFRSNFGDYDELVAFLPVGELQGVCGLAHDQGSRIAVSGVPEAEISRAAERLQQAFNKSYAFGEIDEPLVVDTILRSGAMYYNWLGLLDTNIVVILILMGCVSGFTLISSVFILILERVRMIGQLKSLGATDRLIRRIFILLGGRIVLIGLIIGNAVALIALLCQQTWHLIPLDPQAYYLNYVPVRISWGQVGILNLCVIAASGILMSLPSAVIARISPAKTIRFE